MTIKYNGINFNRTSIKLNARKHSKYLIVQLTGIVCFRRRLTSPTRAGGL